jgi:hypothetical protein
VVPFRQELQFLTAYLEIEQTRFQDRLAVDTDVSLDALEAGVPALLLQPIVENAIQHGTSPRASAGEIAIRARRQGAMLTIEIRDNGPGFPNGPNALKEGVGLSNTRERLRQLYGDRHAFALANSPEGGALVTIALPYIECHEAHTPLHLQVAHMAGICMTVRVVVVDGEPLARRRLVRLLEGEPDAGWSPLVPSREAVGLGPIPDHLFLDVQMWPSTASGCSGAA